MTTDSSIRDQSDTLIRYFDPEIPRDESVSAKGREYTGLLTLGEVPGVSKADYKARRDRVLRQHAVTVHDARSRGLSGWDFERNGFTFAPAPTPVEDFQDPVRIRGEYEPRLLELVKQLTGASSAFLIGQQVRTEETGRGTSSRAYARFAHSDYGPDFEALFRSLLSARYGLPEEEARSCGICCVGFWAPIERPAYKDPLCLLDSSSVDIDNDMIRYIYQGELHFDSKRPEAERVPAAAQDAPAIAPVHSPKHRWFYAPDMQPDEAVIFKQYDWRPNVTSRTSCHSSFNDHFHDDWKECPGRRSLECRILLTFDDNGSANNELMSRPEKE